jgi:Xaa-Pro aminopeptidase
LDNQATKGLEALTADLDRRAGVVHGLMRDLDLRAVVAVATGAPSQAGWLRWLTASELLDGQACVIVEAGRVDPLIVVQEPDHPVALDGGRSRVDVAGAHGSSSGRSTPLRAAEILRDLTGGRGRVGTVDLAAQLAMPDEGQFRRALAGIECVDVTADADRLRQVKSAFEIDAMRETGRLLSDGLDMFAERARPGAYTYALAGETEGYLRGRGCYWGTSKYSMDLQPYLFPTTPDRRLTIDDIPVFEYVYSGPLGYWYILSCLYSFAPLPREVERRLRATEDAIAETARIAVPGATCREVAAASDRAFARHGLRVVDRHTVDCHPIGTDINDGPGDIGPEWALRENMTIAIHPASLAEGGIGFFLCDVFVVRPGGAEPLSARRSFYQRLLR